MVTDVDPLASWSRFLNEDAKHKPCTLCRDALQTSLDDRIEAVWRKLGKIFHVDCWPPNDTGRNGSDNDDGAEPQVQADN
ncbi:uncharacterized protein PHACADRAFT_193722 [Phanerochaete carnosa HHB-10118-sp]|uniref:Uncharacterized protein n=1 Tax=Phanerochaete carnosa (strain HHB-10118-sp) TaxID=650164 RepID=K5X6S9_PHACS|nr:uncharacterized protein PHACADRAFT_193722 [Phanerochaete carnosa HHB-10118-sp]EKM58592.1 hypothetical protein PHACADRAFT_193722 [Phanerochaete carnosa HHB-10118-sp]